MTLWGFGLYLPLHRKSDAFQFNLLCHSGSFLFVFLSIMEVYHLKLSQRFSESHYRVKQPAAKMQCFLSRHYHEDCWPCCFPSAKENGFLHKVHALSYCKLHNKNLFGRYTTSGDPFRHVESAEKTLNQTLGELSGATWTCFILWTRCTSRGPQSVSQHCRIGHVLLSLSEKPGHGCRAQCCTVQRCQIKVRALSCTYITHCISYPDITLDFVTPLYS